LRIGEDADVETSPEQVQRWLDAYVSAWQSYDPAAIGDLFTEDAIYHRNPKTKSARGRDAIVAFWLEEKQHDVPGTYGGHYEPIHMEGNLAVTYGRTEFFDDKGDLDTVYRNTWVLRFAPDGRCSEFHESYTWAPGDEARQPG
jgi:ketosteroid isomerase-like protein